MKRKTKKVFLSALNRLAACALIFALAFCLSLPLPGMRSYAFVFAGAASFCLLSSWNMQTFGFGIRHTFVHIGMAAILIIFSILEILDWCYLGLIPPPWRYILVFEFPIIAICVFLILCKMFEDENAKDGVAL